MGKKPKLELGIANGYVVLAHEERDGRIREFMFTAEQAHEFAARLLRYADTLNGTANEQPNSLTDPPEAKH